VVRGPDVAQGSPLVGQDGGGPARRRLPNKDWAWPTELGDRRALILDVPTTYKGNTQYFDAFRHQLLHGGPEALLAFLQQRQITHELRLVPHTQARS